MTQLNHADLLVEAGRIVKLADFYPGPTGDFRNKDHAQKEAARAGATMLVAGSSIFNADDPLAALRDMRRSIDSAPY